MPVSKRNISHGTRVSTKDETIDEVRLDVALEKIIVCGPGTDPFGKFSDERYLTPDQASELGEMHELYEALRALLTDRIDHVLAAAGMLKLELVATTDIAPLPTLQDVFAPFHQAVKELAANAALPDPACYKSASRYPRHVAVLKALANSGCRVVFLAGKRRVEIPVLGHELFPRGPDKTPTRLTGPFRIVGICRDDVAGHCFYVGDNRICVRLPKNDLRFEWQAIHLVLELAYDLVGDLIRNTKADEWTPTPEASVEPALVLPLE